MHEYKATEHRVECTVGAAITHQKTITVQIQSYIAIASNPPWRASVSVSDSYRHGVIRATFMRSAFSKPAHRLLFEASYSKT